MPEPEFGTSLLVGSGRPTYPPTMELPDPPERPFFGPLLKYTAYAVVAGLIFHCALSSQKETARLRGERRKIQAEIARLQHENTIREKVLVALASDPFYVERVLRERYGYRGVNEEDPAPPRTSMMAETRGSVRADAARTAGRTDVVRTAGRTTTRRR